MEKITLKKYITHNNKYVLFLVCAGVISALYTLSGAISYQTGQLLPLLDFELNLPLIPWTIWIYIVLYPLYIIWCLLSYKDEIELNKLLYAFHAVTIFSCFIFIIFPVNYPRELYPLDSDMLKINEILFRFVRLVDKPSNCLPSLHVGFCFSFAFGWLRTDKLKFSISFLIATAIAISTLTTKQHYAYDIIAGFLVAVTSFTIFDKFTVIKD